MIAKLYLSLLDYARQSRRGVRLIPVLLSFYSWSKNKRNEYTDNYPHNLIEGAD